MRFQDIPNLRSTVPVVDGYGDLHPLLCSPVGLDLKPPKRDSIEPWKSNT